MDTINGITHVVTSIDSSLASGNRIIPQSSVDKRYIFILAELT